MNGFTAEERARLGLIGRLPSAVETLGDQVVRVHKQAKQTFSEQRLVVFGAGTAGTGMADQISAATIRGG